MFIRTLTGSTQYNDEQIQKDGAKIGLKIKTNVAGFLNLFLGLITISVDVIKSNGKQLSMYTQHKLSEIMEFSQMKEGFIRIVHDGSDYTIYCEVELGVEGMIGLQNDEYISVGLRGLQTTDIIDMSILELPFVGESVYKFNKNSVQKNDTNKPLTSLGEGFLILPKEPNILEELRMISKDGKTISYRYDDMIRLLDMTNDLCFCQVDNTGVVEAQTLGSGNFFIISIAMFGTIEIITNGSDSLPFTIVELVDRNTTAI
jgi:hypothetical protein